MKERDSEGNSVQGERDSSTLAHAPSVQSRISNLLAIGLMSALGLGMLMWYYANAMTRQSHARVSVRASVVKQAQSGDSPLPSLGRIDPPVAEKPPQQDLLPDSAVMPATPLHAIPLQAAPAATGYGPAPPKTPAQLMLERQLSGTVFSPSALQGVAPNLGPAPVAAQETGELGALLRPSVTTAVSAQVLPTQRLLLPKGAFLDCTLETAIDSTLPGVTTCITATDTFGVDGQVVLLERGTKLVGETRGQVQQGSVRVFVLWNEARTPAGVIVPLASPGADELGRAGLPGSVDRHFWERFGAAMLVSVIDGAVRAAVQSSGGNNGTVIVNPSRPRMS